MTPGCAENGSETLALTSVSTVRAVVAMNLGLACLFVPTPLSFVLAYPFGQTSYSAAAFLFAFTHNALALTGTWVIIRFLLKQRPDTYGLAGPVLPLRWAPTAIIVPAVCIGLITLATPGEWLVPEVYWERSEVVNMALRVLYFPVVDEVIFHGLMYTLMKTWLSPWWAATFTGTVFATAHLFLSSYGYRFTFSWTPSGTVQVILTSTALAIFLAAVVELTGSVWNAAWCHVVWKLVLALTSIDTVQGDNILFSYVITDDNRLLTGHDGRFGDSLLTVPVLLVCAGLLMWLARRRQARPQEVMTLD